MHGHNMDRGTDAELVVAARQGDLDTFATLVGRYRDARAPRSRTGSPETKQRMPCRTRS